MADDADYDFVLSLRATGLRISMDKASLLLAIVVAGFATASLARLVTREAGLFGVFVRLRNLFPSEGTLHDIFTCPLCFSVWAAGVTTGLTMALLGIPILWFVLLAPAALGVAYAALGLAAMIQ